MAKIINAITFIIVRKNSIFSERIACFLLALKNSSSSGLDGLSRPQAGRPASAALGGLAGGL